MNGAEGSGGKRRGAGAKGARGIQCTRVGPKRSQHTPRVVEMVKVIPYIEPLLWKKVASWAEARLVMWDNTAAWAASEAKSTCSVGSLSRLKRHPGRPHSTFTVLEEAFGMASEGYAPLPWYLGRRKGEERERKERSRERKGRSDEERVCMCVRERGVVGGTARKSARERERARARA